MVDYIGVGKGVLWFFLGVIFTAVAWYTIPAVIDILPADAEFARGLGWFCIIMIAVLFLGVLPIYQIITATKGD